MLTSLNRSGGHLSVSVIVLLPTFVGAREETDLHWTSVVAIPLAAALNSAVVAPALVRYKAWKESPREKVARRNWRGVYVPDLAIIRLQRVFWIGWAIVIAMGFGYLFMISG